MTARVASLHVYPVKGCRGIDLPDAHVEATGIRHDRQLLLVRSDGDFVTQREAPRLARVVPELAPLDDGWLHVAAGEQRLRVRLRQDGPRRDVRVWAYRGSAVDQGDDAAAWFSAVAGVAVRLVAFPADHVRAVDPQYGAGRVGFADDFPVHLVSAASVADLGRRLAEPVGADRFRPNLVVEGWTEPYVEDTLAALAVGGADGVTFDVVRAAPRCVVTTVDQVTGERAGVGDGVGPATARAAEPLATLSAYRRGALGVHFGQHLVPRASGRLTVGAEVTVLAAGRAALPADPGPRAARVRAYAPRATRIH